MGLRAKNSICLLLNIIIFCLGNAVTCDAQSKQRRKNPKRLVESGSLEPPIVSSDCVLEEAPEDCLTNSNNPKPDAKWKRPKGRRMISDCFPMTGKVVSYPKICYPKIAKAAHASGTVKIEVVIDEKGKVIWARAVDGHPLLRFAALRAACQTRVKPTIDCYGRAVKVNTFLYFNFKLS